MRACLGGDASLVSLVTDGRRYDGVTEAVAELLASTSAAGRALRKAMCRRVLSASRDTEPTRPGRLESCGSGGSWACATTSGHLPSARDGEGNYRRWVVLLLEWGPIVDPSRHPPVGKTRFHSTETF